MQTGLHKREIPGGAELAKSGLGRIAEVCAESPFTCYPTKAAARGIEDVSPVLKTDNGALLFPSLPNNFILAQPCLPQLLLILSESSFYC